MELYLIIGLGILQFIVIVVIYRMQKELTDDRQLLQVLNQLYKERFKMIHEHTKTKNTEYGLFSEQERNAWKEQICRVYPERKITDVNDFLNENYKDFGNVTPLKNG